MVTNKEWGLLGLLMFVLVASGVTLSSSELLDVMIENKVAVFSGIAAAAFMLVFNPLALLRDSFEFFCEVSPLVWFTGLTMVGNVAIAYSFSIGATGIFVLVGSIALTLFLPVVGSGSSETNQAYVFYAGITQFLSMLVGTISFIVFSTEVASIAWAILYSISLAMVLVYHVGIYSPQQVNKEIVKQKTVAFAKGETRSYEMPIESGEIGRQAVAWSFALISSFSLAVGIGGAMVL